MLNSKQISRSQILNSKHNEYIRKHFYEKVFIAFGI